MAAKHLATYPIYGTHPITLAVTKRQVATGYIYDPKTYDRAARQMAKEGQPFRPRWRNDECRRQFEEMLRAEQSGR